MVESVRIKSALVPRHLGVISSVNAGICEGLASSYGGVDTYINADGTWGHRDLASLLGCFCARKILHGGDQRAGINLFRTVKGLEAAMQGLHALSTSYPFTPDLPLP